MCLSKSEDVQGALSKKVTVTVEATAASFEDRMNAAKHSIGHLVYFVKLLQ